MKKEHLVLGGTSWQHTRFKPTSSLPSFSSPILSQFLPLSLFHLTLSPNSFFKLTLRQNDYVYQVKVYLGPTLNNGVFSILENIPSLKWDLINLFILKQISLFIYLLFSSQNTTWARKTHKSI